MTSAEFNQYMNEMENFYKQPLDTSQRKIWYESLNFMSIARFNYILAEIYKESKFMPKLAEVLERHKQIPYEATQPTKSKNRGICKKCNGTGYIIYTQIIDNQPHKYAVVCSCGTQVRYDGRNCHENRNKSKYYIPTEQEKGLKCQTREMNKENILQSMIALQKSPLISNKLKEIITTKLNSYSKL